MAIPVQMSDFQTIITFINFAGHTIKESLQTKKIRQCCNMIVIVTQI